MLGTLSRCLLLELETNKQHHPLPPRALAPRRQYETFSYLPPLTSDQIARQVDYIVGNGWIPCLEFSEPANAYVSNANTIRFGPVSCVSGLSG